MTTPASHRRHHLLAALLAAFSTVAIVTLIRNGCSDNEAVALSQPVTKGGVTLSHVVAPGLEPGPAVQAQIGDWLLATKGLSLSMGADAAGVERQLRHGAMLDVSVGDFHTDHLLGLRTVVELAGVDQPLKMKGVRPLLDGPTPRLLVEQESFDGALELATRVELTPGSERAALVTRITNTQKTPLAALAVGDEVSWPGAATFAPRLGFVEAAARERVPWIARRGQLFSSALAYPDGADVEFRFDPIGPRDQRAMTRAAELAAGASREVTRYLVVAPGGLAGVARVAWKLSGKDVRVVRGKLDPAPSWATVEAEHPDGKPVLTVRAQRDGSFELPLPPGEYRLLLRAPGGEDSESVTLEPGSDPREVRLIPPEPGMLRFTVVDSEQAPLAARWLVRGIPPTKTPFFGPAERAEGAGHAGYTLTGEGRVELPPGRYRMLFTHGPEYALWEQAVSVTAEAGATVRAVLPRKVDSPGWIAGDFHLHAAPSHDSSVSLEDRVTALVAAGIEVAVPTDHNHVTDYAPTLRGFDAESRLATMPGVELTTTRWGHFNAYPYPLDAGLPATGELLPRDLFARVRELAPGVLVQVNHPRMADIGYFNRAELDSGSMEAGAEGFSFDFDTLEVVNGFELGQPKVIDENLREWFRLLEAGHRYTAMGNSDSHQLSREWAGYPRTYLRVPDDRPGHVTAEQIVSALRGGRAFVSNGPFLDVRVGGQEPGGLAVADEGEVSVQVSVQAPAFIDITRAEVWIAGERVAETERVAAPTAPLRLTWQTRVAVARDTWVVVVVRGSRELDDVLPGVHAAPLAFTNPVWIDADGDGSYGDAGADAAADAASDAGPETPLPDAAK
ncbi:MAG: CehA/McbA family metallohydrolase [Myxococcales bacterium]|nr:CehA/McbA family metallohydrolase [Myxococcales bacterium]MCB9577366.1 CehA/McbA family metallohydrolase [Polyangiaceae bacterium]